MKNKRKMFKAIRSIAIIAIVAMIGLSMAACDLEIKPPSPPSTPSNFRVVDPMSSSHAGVFETIHLQWSSSPSADGYRILRSNTANGSYSQIAEVTTGTSYQDTYLDDGTRRFYKIKAYNSVGESAESAVIVGTTAFRLGHMGSLSGNPPFTGSFTQRDLLAGETHYYFIWTGSNNFAVAWGDLDRSTGTNLTSPIADIMVGIRQDGYSAYVYDMCDWGWNGPTKNTSRAHTNFFAFSTASVADQGWYTVVVKGFNAASSGNYSIAYRVW